MADERGIGGSKRIISAVEAAWLVFLYKRSCGLKRYEKLPITFEAGS